MPSARHAHTVREKFRREPWQRPQTNVSPLTVPVNGEAHCRQNGGSIRLAEETQVGQTMPGSISARGRPQKGQFLGQIMSSARRAQSWKTPVRAMV